MIEAEPATVLLVAGSLRHGGFTTRLLHATAAFLRVPVVDSDDVRNLPMYDADLDTEAAQPSVAAARRRVSRSAGLLISTPQYNGTIPGGLKNWLDWMSRPFRAHVLIGKPVAVLGAAPGSGGALPAVTWLRSTLGSLGAVVVGEVVAVPNVADRFDATGAPVDDVLLQLHGLAMALGDAIASVGHAGTTGQPS